MLRKVFRPWERKQQKAAEYCIIRSILICTSRAEIAAERRNACRVLGKRGNLQEDLDVKGKIILK
jgi:hypothetical protein